MLEAKETNSRNGHYNRVIIEPLIGFWILSKIKIRTINWTSTFLCISGFVDLLSSSYRSSLMWRSQFFFLQDANSGSITGLPKKLKRKAPFWNTSLLMEQRLAADDGWMAERQLGYETERQEAKNSRKIWWMCFSASEDLLCHLLCHVRTMHFNHNRSSSRCMSQLSVKHTVWWENLMIVLNTTWKWWSDLNFLSTKTSNLYKTGQQIHDLYTMWLQILTCN